MNHALATDASVAVKWVLAEEFSAQALALLASSARASVPILAPYHLPAEVTNALFQRVRSSDPAKHLSIDQAEEALRRFSRVQLQLMLPAELPERALRFAHDNRLPTVYDALYVLMAEIAGVELWTADRRLVNAVRYTAPHIRFIGDYPLP